MKGRKNMAKKIGLVGIYFPGPTTRCTKTCRRDSNWWTRSSGGLRQSGGLRISDFQIDIDPDIINHTPNVKFWQRWGAGFDHVDLKAWGERGFRLRPVRASIPALWRSWRSC